MKISKSKRQLAEFITLDGGWKDGSFAAQEQNGFIYFYFDKPRKSGAFWHGSSTPTPSIKVARLSNWHQTVLSRAEFDQIVSETAPDADGWIEWGGGKCPVDEDCMVVCKISGGELWDGGAPTKAMRMGWEHDGFLDIIAYRLHKPEQAEEPAEGESPEQRAKLASIYAPTLDQLLQDWRNADDYAKRKQVEAHEAAALREERWQAVQARTSEMGVTVGRSETDPDLVINDWRDLQFGDVIFVAPEGGYISAGDYEVIEIASKTYLGGRAIRVDRREKGSFWIDILNGWRFIRRP